MPSSNVTTTECLERAAQVAASSCVERVAERHTRPLAASHAICASNAGDGKIDLEPGAAADPVVDEHDDARVGPAHDVATRPTDAFTACCSAALSRAHRCPRRRGARAQLSWSTIATPNGVTPASAKRDARLARLLRP